MKIEIKTPLIEFEGKYLEYKVNSDNTNEWKDPNYILPKYHYSANGENFTFVICDHKFEGVHECMFCEGLFYPSIFSSSDNCPMDRENLKEWSKNVTRWKYLPQSENV